MSITSLNKQLKHLMARATQLESATGAQHLANSLLQFNMLAVVYTAPACVATIPFFNMIPVGFELMQMLVSSTLGKIYSRIQMELAEMLDVEGMFDSLVESGINSAESILNQKMSMVTDTINQFTAQVDQLGAQANQIYSNITNLNGQISDLQQSLVAETDQQIINSINSQISSLETQVAEATDLFDQTNSQLTSIQNNILNNLQGDVISNLQQQIVNFSGLSIGDIFSSQGKLGKQQTNSFHVSNP